jgi:hypothetical protein
MLAVVAFRIPRENFEDCACQKPSLGGDRIPLVDRNGSLGMDESITVFTTGLFFALYNTVAQNSYPSIKKLYVFAKVVEGLGGSRWRENLPRIFFIHMCTNSSPLRKCSERRSRKIALKESIFLSSGHFGYHAFA